MPDKHHPIRGSKGYSPRKRAKSEIPRFKSWPEREGEPKIQGFAGYKAGMTHAFLVDYRPTSTTSKQEVRVPVTVIEVPPMKVAAVRLYEHTSYGLKTKGEVWAQKVEKELAGRLPIPKNYETKEAWKKVNKKNVDDVRLLVYTQPRKVSGIPKKTPDIMEVRVGGGSIEERIRYAKKMLGKEVRVKDFTNEGEMVDVASITKGKGFQGHVKRWGIKLLDHKNSKHRRMVGTLGPWNPHYVHRNVPQAGQVGYHQRTEYNKRVLKIGENGEEITPNGGFVRYGVLKNEYVIMHGSVPGPVKRLVRFRDSVRFHGEAVEKPELIYISTESNQGA
jgi:large subunit ribosomal protein L3